MLQMDGEAVEGNNLAHKAAGRIGATNQVLQNQHPMARAGTFWPYGTECPTAPPGIALGP